MKRLLLLCALMVFSISSAQNADERKKPEYTKLDKNRIQVVTYHENGEVSQKGTFYKDKPHGEWVSYDNNGKKTAVAQYDKGKRTGTWFYWVNDELKQVSYEGNNINEVVTWRDKSQVATRN